MDAWSQVPRDVWFAIGEKLDVGDRIRFRSVCRTWRSSLPFPQPPWLMLAEDEKTPNTRGFLGLGQGEEESDCVYQFELPEVYHTRTVGSTGKWLVTLDLRFRIRLLNIFSRVCINLPSLPKLVKPGRRGLNPDYVRNYCVRKVVLSSTPSSFSSSGGGGDGSCIAMTLYQSWKHGYARPGDTGWTPVATRFHVRDILCYKGRFYGITASGQLITYTLGKPATATQISDKIENVRSDGNDGKYLVECAGELLVVVRFMRYKLVSGGLLTHQVLWFEVFKFDLARRKWTPLKDLGKYSLFVGFNTSAAVLVSSKCGLKKNCIYFTDDAFYFKGTTLGHDSGVFDLEDNTFRPYSKVKSVSPYSPPIWIVPQSMLL